MKSRNSEFMGKDKISKLLLKLSIPAMIGMAVNALYNLVDTIFVGNCVGPMAIAGLSIAFPLQMIITSVALLFGVGSATVVSIRLGEKKEDEASSTAGNGITLSFIFSIVMLIFGLIFLDQLLYLFGSTSQILPYSKAYMRIILLGVPFLSFSMQANNLFRSEGKAKTSMFIMSIGLIANIILDPIFIYFLDLGIQGAALATVIGQILSFLLAFILFACKKSNLHFKPHNFVLHFRYVKNIIVLGLPTFIRQLGGSIMSLLVNNMLRLYGGNDAIAAFGMANRLLIFFILPSFGIMQALQPIIGYNFGANKYDRVKEALKKATIVVAFYSFIVTLICFIFSHSLMYMFTQDTKLIDLASIALKSITISLVFISVQGCSVTYFQAVGRGKIAIFFGLLRQFIVLAPLLLILPKLFGLWGIWYCFATSDISTTILIVIVLLINLRKLK